MNVEFAANHVVALWRGQRGIHFCFSDGGDSSSETSNINQQVAASEGSLAVGAGGKFIESGGADLTGSQIGRLGGSDTTVNGKVLSDSLDLAGAGDKQVSGGDLISGRVVAEGGTDVSGRLVSEGATDVSGKVLGIGSSDLAGASNVGNTDFSGAQDVSITTSDPEVLNKALDKISELSAGFGSSLNQFVSGAAEDQSKKVSELFGLVEQGKESQDTAAQNRKIFVTLALAILALIAFLRFRKN